MSPVLRRTGALVLAVVAVLLAALAAGWQSTQPPLPGRVNADAFTVVGSSVLEAVARLAALLTGGLTFAAVALTPAAPTELAVRHTRTLGWEGRRAVRGATVAGIVWAVAGFALIPFNAGATNGIPVTWVTRAVGDYLVSSQPTQAWLLTALAAVLATWTLARARTWPVAVLALAITIWAAFPTIVTGAVSVGADHDFATDLAGLSTLALTVWAAAVVGLAFVAEPSVAALRRVARIGLVLGPIAILTRVGVAWQELAGVAPWRVAFGLVVLALIGVLALALVVAAVRRAGPRLVGVDAALAVVATGLVVALHHLDPPRFAVPQSPQVNYLGFDLGAPPSWPEILAPGRPNLFFTAFALAAIALYVAGYVRLRRRHDAWPLGRLVTWVLGWVVVLGLSVTRVWVYSSAMFSFHMSVHMTLNMLVPVLLVMGGPITLALRATRSHRPEELPGLRDLVTAAMQSRLGRILTHPALIWVVFIASFYVLYFSSLFTVAMRYHWAHQLMMVHFLITGYLFYGLAIGVDEPPRPVPHVAKLGFVFAAMPFHAFFAVGVLSAGIPIGKDFYDSIATPWVHDLLADQNIGGQIAWATGELPLLIIIVALVAQWWRQDRRTARRLDRAQDSGRDDSYDAYNEMLAELARRDDEGKLRR